MLGLRPKFSNFHIQRPRLLNLLPEESGYVVCLEAPYGYGKSVLAAQWADRLEQQGYTILWISAESNDLKTALLQLLELPPDSPWSIIYDRLWTPKCFVVIEDINSSEELKPILKNLRGLLLLASRQTIDSPELLKLRTQGLVLRIGAEHLAFTQEEATNLFNDDKKAQQAWQHSLGWPLPLHFSALVGETPDPKTLIRGIKSSLKKEVWNEALLISALPYLPETAKSEAAYSLQKAGFVQVLENGLRLHPLVRETLMESFIDDIQQVIIEQKHRFVDTLYGELLANANLLDDLASFMEEGIRWQVCDPLSILRWNSLLNNSNHANAGPNRQIAVANATLLTGNLSKAIEQFLSIARTKEYDSNHKIMAYGIAIYRLSTSDLKQARELIQEVGSGHYVDLEDASNKVKAVYFNNISNAATTHAEAESMIIKGLDYCKNSEQDNPTQDILENNLVRIRWEAKGELEAFHQCFLKNVTKTDNPAIVPYNNLTLGFGEAYLGQIENAIKRFETAMSYARYNPKWAIAAEAFRAQLLNTVEPFPRLYEDIVIWQDAYLIDLVLGFWGRTLRKSGKVDAALSRLENGQGIYSQVERALCYLSKNDSQAALSELNKYSDIFLMRAHKIWIAMARFKISGDPADLEALMALTSIHSKILVGLLDVDELPKNRPDLSTHYSIEKVLQSNWQEAIELRRSEIPALELTLLGDFKTKVLGKEVDLTDRSKQILCLLALEHNRDEIATLMWPEADTKKSRNNLNVQLNLLRKTVEPWGISSYLFESGLKNTISDFYLLQDAINKHDADNIITLYKEPFATGLYLDVIEDSRELLRSKVINCLYNAVPEAPTDKARQYLEHILEIDACHEDALQLLLKMLLKRGRRLEATKRFQKFARILKSEMGLEPLPTTQELLHN